MLRLKIKTYSKLSLGEYGRQRTSTKFHDLVLNLKFQNSRVLETILFLALFSLRKVSVYVWMRLLVCISFNYSASLSLFYVKKQFVYILKEAGTKVLASQLFLDCRARRSGWVGSTTLISSAFTVLLNCAEVGRRNRILTNYRFLSHSLAVYWLCFQLL